MSTFRVDRRRFVFGNMSDFHYFLPPNTVILDSQEDFLTQDFILTVKYDFNWTLNRVSPRGDNIGSDYDFGNDDE